MLVKVCGMRDADNIREVEAIGIDLMGFIFYEKSKRFVGTCPPSYLPKDCRRVGVFVNSDIEYIEKMTREFGLDLIQLHGSESVQFCRDLSERLPKAEIIKVFSIASREDIQRTGEYEGAVKYFLFDTATKGYGGSGVTFDWSILDDYRGRTPFLLSGGISPQSLPEIKALSHPMWAGVDLNSRFEVQPARKDATLLEEFIKSLRCSFNK